MEDCIAEFGERNNSSDICVRDEPDCDYSGGILIFIDPQTGRHSLVGIHSDSNADSKAKIYTRITTAFMLDWLREETEEKEAETPASCGRQAQSIEQFPYVAVATGSDYVSTCFLIDAHWLITSAHAMWEIDFHRLFSFSHSDKHSMMRVGTLDWRTGGQSCAIREIVKHPQCELNSSLRRKREQGTKCPLAWNHPDCFAGVHVEGMNRQQFQT